MNRRDSLYGHLKSDARQYYGHYLPGQVGRWKKPGPPHLAAPVVHSPAAYRRRGQLRSENAAFRWRVDTIKPNRHRRAALQWRPPVSGAASLRADAGRTMLPWCGAWRQSGADDAPALLLTPPICAHYALT